MRLAYTFFMGVCPVAKHKQLTYLYSGLEFTTDGDFGRLTFRVKRLIRLLPYKNGVGYTVEAMDNGRFAEIENVDFNPKAVFDQRASRFIGRHGATEYVDSKFLNV
jgi:hypothetical protein